MTHCSTDSLLTALRWRYATKQFDPSRVIPADTWAAIEESMVLTPSSFGLQPWRFLVIDDPELRAKLRAESWNQPQVTDASHYVVLAARTNVTEKEIDTWIHCLATTQDREPDAFAPLRGMIVGFAETMSCEQRHQWNKRQVYIALGQVMTAAAMLGIDACPMEGISTAGYDRLLGLEGGGYATAVGCAFGYRSPEDKYASIPKARFPHEDVVKHV